MTRSRFKIVAFTIDSNLCFNKVVTYNKTRAQPNLSLLLERSFLNGSLEYGCLNGG